MNGYINAQPLHFSGDLLDATTELYTDLPWLNVGSALDGVDVVREAPYALCLSC